MAIQKVESELFVLRKGKVTARIDLERGILTWQESQRWNRDFTRSIPRAEREAFRALLEACNPLAWEPVYIAESASCGLDHLEGCQESWELRLYDEADHLLRKIQGYDSWPPCFCQLAEGISRLLRQPFQVSL